MTYDSQKSGAGSGASAVNSTANAAEGAPAVPDSVVAKGFAGAPSGKLVEITRELVDKEAAARPKGIPQDVQKLFAKATPYEIGPGDILSIVVWDHPELNLPTGAGGSDGPTGASSVAPGYTVDTDGFIQYAYIGPLKVAGLSEMTVREVLAQKLAKYVRQPQITVRIQTYRSKRVYLDGEVKTPGVQVLNDRPMTLPEAINRAGGFTSNADRSHVAVTRGDTTVDVDMPAMIRKGFNPDRIVLGDGDLVRIFAQTDSKVFVVGEVERPGGVTFNNGRMSLNEALGNAGGINQSSGDASQVYVVRGRDTTQPTVFHLDASSAASMATADSFELKPNDVVFVDTSSLVKWSRVISLILPTTQAAAATRAVGY
ncbi:polysaccharide export outer membrane protein [Paraburkholderia bannensis]|uniref:Polysaccharide export outer membrane protein n=1 Tax=Paraburkholderia bannensis TaxID=765414 RepID=A0A7W9WTP8_9BURK|nr:MULTISPECIES: polysaccharide biosynthesis/export family protein [Paraburkholderia]MBB3257975.1 polysaccharide export outer membrane protein [Paraburkholderia sp. WP4_3_2]MBB6102988.1 polysaccharide export outer membrane protein [Paraburkholderia bannensis]